MINEFRGDNDIFSNFYLKKLKYEDIVYEDSETAFQASKCKFNQDKLKFKKLKAFESKKLGRQIKLRDDWETVKDKIMYDIILIKFSDSILKQKLLNTGEEYIEEGNTWHDNYWGNCTCYNCRNITGKNILGKILMDVRQQFRLKQGETVEK